MPAFEGKDGMPFWQDLTTTNLLKSTNSYRELFGWEIVDQGPDFGHYHIARKDGVDVAGFMRAMNMDGTPEPSMPTAWSTYLNTKNIDHTFKKAVNDGAHEVVGPMAVGPLGQMAVVVDEFGGNVTRPLVVTLTTATLT